MPHRFRRDLGIASVASVISFAISIALTPVMTRWYQPDDYGVFAVINNLATFLATLFLLSLPNALPIVRTWHARARLLRTLMALTMVSFLVTAVGTTLFLLISHVRAGIVSSDWAFVLLPFLVLVISLHRIAQNWANADGDFNSMAAARVVHPMVAKPFAIAASMLSSANPIYIIFFEGVAYVLQAMTMVRGRINKINGIFLWPNGKSAALGLATIRRLKDYALLLNSVNLLSLGLITLQTLILTAAYSHTETGHFALAMSMASLPIQLISMATAPVIYHRLIACERENPNTLIIKISKLLLAFSVLGALPYLSIFYCGPSLFSFAFGQEWELSGQIASILALPIFLQFLYTPISSIFRVTARIKLQLRIDLLFVPLTVLVLLIATRSMPFLDALFVLALTKSIHQVVGIGFCLAASNPRPTRDLA